VVIDRRLFDIEVEANVRVRLDLLHDPGECDGLLLSYSMTNE
jgi:hypothetical protein